MFTKIKGALWLVFCAAVVGSLATQSAYADDWDKATKITINQPFEIPGMVLPAGTYMVRLVDIAGERHVARFLSEDESKVFATVIGIPDFRLTTTDKTSMTFYESDVGAPRPMHAWFYPGHQFGLEFAYPEKRAVQIAAKAEEHVIATKEPAFVPLAEEAKPPTVKELIEEPLVVVEPGGKEVELAEVHPEPTPTPPPEAPPIPKTATPFPLIALMGFIAAGAASTLRMLRK